MNKDNITYKILNKIIKGCVYGLTALMPLFFLPIRAGSLDFHKQALLVLLSMIGLAAFVLKILLKKRVEIKKTFLNYIVLGLLLVLSASTVFSWSRAQSFFGSVSLPAAGLLTWLSLVVFFFLVVNHFNSTDQVERLTLVGLSSALVVGLFSLTQMWNKFLLPWQFTKTQAFNTVGSIHALGIFMAAVLPLVITLFLVKKKWWIKANLAILGVLSFIILLITNYWISWVCLAIGMVALLILLEATPAKTKEGWIVLPVVLLVLAFSFVLVGVNLPGLPNLPATVSPTYGSDLQIANKIISGEQGILRAVVGTGPGTFNFLYGLYKSEAISRTAFWGINFESAHSQLLGLLSTTGLLGSLSLLSVIFGFGWIGIRQLVKKQREKFGVSSVTYIATAEALDQEMEERIAHHKSQRPGDWETIEEPIDIYQAIQGIDNKQTVLIDCLTLYISNLLLKEEPDEELDLEQKKQQEADIVENIKQILKYTEKNNIDLIIVSNEVGQGLVPSYEMGRFFRDISGRANQFIAKKANKVYLTVAGFPLDLNEISKVTEENMAKYLGEI